MAEHLSVKILETDKMYLENKLQENSILHIP